MIRNVKVIPGLLQYVLLAIDDVSREMGKKLTKKPRRKTWLLRDEEKVTES